MNRISVAINGELFSFDGLSEVKKDNNGVVVIEPNFDESSSKEEWKIDKREVYFHLDSNKQVYINTEHMTCNSLIYKDANNKFKLIAHKY